MRDPSAGRTTMVGRGLRGRCPRCGGGAIFRSWGRLHRNCPSCGFRFEREAGYFVGAMIINTTVTIVLFLSVLVIGSVVTWPDVPWVGLFAATVVVAGVLPVGFYPISKTLWMAIELGYHPLEEDERREAAAHLG